MPQIGTGDCRSGCIPVRERASGVFEEEKEVAMERTAEFRVITAKELADWVGEGRELVIVDTLPEEHYRRIHLPGALNACVYQVVYLERMVVAS